LQLVISDISVQPTMKDTALDYYEKHS